MAVYLYNLGFSASNAANGNFSSGGSGINLSQSWYQYIPSGLPAGANPNLSYVTSLGGATSWSYQSQPPATTQAGQDYLIVRIFNSDNNPGNFLLRATMVFGQGDSANGLTPNGTLQSPFRTVNGNAMPVISSDRTQPPPPNPPTLWDAPFTDVNPVTSASSWTYCLGMLHNPTLNTPTVYVFNIGASVYDLAGNRYYYYGIDPRMKVGGMGVPVAKDAA